MTFPSDKRHNTAVAVTAIPGCHVSFKITALAACISRRSTASCFLGSREQLFWEAESGDSRPARFGLQEVQGSQQSPPPPLPALQLDFLPATSPGCSEKDARCRGPYPAPWALLREQGKTTGLGPPAALPSTTWRCAPRTSLGTLPGVPLTPYLPRRVRGNTATPAGSYRGSWLQSEPKGRQGSNRETCSLPTSSPL